MVFVVVPMVGNNAIRATGDTKTPGIIMLVAGIVNGIMDPLLIFGPGPFPRLELAGAAIATVIARAITLTVAIWVLGYRDKMLTAKIASIRAVYDSWKSILYIALPTAGTRVIVPFSIGVITRLLASYGPEAVAGFGVAMRIEFLAMTVIFALATVVGPFVGQNLGAGRLDRVHVGLKYSKRFSMAWGAALFAVLAISGRWIAPLFSDNADVVSATVLYLMIVPACYGVQGVLQFSTTALNVLQRPLHAATLMIIQMFALYLPLAYLGSHLFGIAGVFLGVVVAYFIGGLAGHIALGRVLIAEEIEYAD
jgi:Na+-driven multidrug efflux pump